MGITIKQLSELSGYSCATISRVLSNKGNVRPETREAVEKLLLEHQYRTNIMELRSRSRRKQTVMVIVGILGTTWYAEQIRVIKSELLLHGYTTLIGFSDNRIEEEENMVRLAIEEDYAGILFLNVRGGDAISALLKQSGIPVVFLNREIQFSGFDAVLGDKYAEGHLITRHLIEMGHRKIGFLLGDEYSLSLQERRRGYEDAMHAAHLYTSDRSIIQTASSYAGGYEAGVRLIERGLDFTAVVCSTELMVLGLVSAMGDYRIAIPEQLSIASCDDGFYPQYYQVTATGGIGAEKTARRASAVLLQKLKDPAAEVGTVVFRPELVVRSSVIKR